MAAVQPAGPEPMMITSRKMLSYFSGN